MAERRFLLNRNDGIDTLHTEHGPEQCNRDDVEGRQVVDENTAMHLKAGGLVRICKHCEPLKEDPS